jgi:hypothetical protein
VKEYEYSLDLPHSTERIWAIMQDYDKWPEFAKPMVTGIKVIKKGDKIGNGLIRSVSYKLPLGFKGNSIETISGVEPGVSYTYTSQKGTVGTIKLEKLGANKTRLFFKEYLKLNPPFSWFEGSIKGFIEKYNKKTMLNMSRWLDEHHVYRRDLI